MSDLNKLEAAYRIIRVAIGEDLDGLTVTALGRGYAEPGYASDAVWALGDWNPARFPRDGEPSLTKEEALPQRLGNALERIGVECEWSDEWTECQECWRIVRTQPDSYGWKASCAWLEDVGPVCHECLRGYGEDALEQYINEPSRAVTWADEDLLEDYGYTRYNETEYESGFHPGRNDNPTTILAEIQAERPDAQVVFLIDGVGQFEIHFAAYVKENTDDQES